MKLIDITGQRFGRLTALRIAPRQPYQKRQWICRCDCGGETKADYWNLSRGHWQSCGCLSSVTTTKRNTTHGLSKTPEYKIWAGIISRCTIPSSSSFQWYGAKGIGVCERWRQFEHFYADMGPRPSKHHSIDRRDGLLDYGPENCRWATLKEQADSWKKSHQQRLIRSKRFE